MAKNFWTRLAAAAAILLTALPLFAAEKMQTVAVASIAGYDPLIQSVEKVAGTIGQKDLFDTLMIMTGDVEGLDKTLPAGAAVMTNGSEMFIVGFVPVADLDALEGPGADALKENWNAETGILTIDNDNGSVDLKLTFRDGWCLITQDGRDYLPEGNPAELLEGLDKEYLIGFRFYPDRIPPELVDTLLTPIRQQLADLDADAADKAENSIEATLNLFDMCSSLSGGMKVAPSGDLVFSCQTAAKPGTELDKVYQKLAQATTVWPDMYRPEEAVFSAVSRSMAISMFQQNMQDSTRQVIDAVLEWIEMNADPDEPGVETLQTAVRTFGEFLTDEIAAGDDDTVVTFPVDGPLEFASTTTSGDKLIASMDQFAAAWKEITEAAQKAPADSSDADDSDDSLENNAADEAAALSDLPDEYIQNCRINGSQYAGYKVSTMTVKLPEELNFNLNGGALTVDSVSLLLGVKKDAVILLAGVDKKKIADRFKILANTKRKPALIPEKQFQFSLKNFADFCARVLTQTDDEELPINAVLNNCPADAVICGGSTFQQGTAGMTQNVQLTISAPLMKTVADIVEVIRKAGNEDSSEDLDSDVFDDSEEESL